MNDLCCTESGASSGKLKVWGWNHLQVTHSHLWLLMLAGHPGLAGLSAETPTSRWPGLLIHGSCVLRASIATELRRERAGQVETMLPVTSILASHAASLLLPASDRGLPRFKDSRMSMTHSNMSTWGNTISHSYQAS